MNRSFPTLRAFTIFSTPDAKSICATTFEFDIIQSSSRCIRLAGFGRFLGNLPRFVAFEGIYWESRALERKCLFYNGIDNFAWWSHFRLTSAGVRPDDVYYDRKPEKPDRDA